MIKNRNKNEIRVGGFKCLIGITKAGTNYYTVIGELFITLRYERVGGGVGDSSTVRGKYLDIHYS